MKICVYGLWHLGCVTAACVAERFDTVATDPDSNVIARLRGADAPIAEPGLRALLASGAASGRLVFVEGIGAAVSEADIVWITFDTPVDESDRADEQYVIERIRDTFPHLRSGAVVLISSQVPAGTTAFLEREYRALHPVGEVAFAYSPENLRLGKAIEVFRNPGRIVVGVRESSNARPRLEPLLSVFCANLIWMSVESAEMTKHALNAFLADSVSFINEIALLCEAVGADAKQVEQGLKSDERIGQRAYLGPGGPFAGGTLARDVQFLLAQSRAHRIETPLLEAIWRSNDLHKHWYRKTLVSIFQSIRGRRICILGLTYKPGTDTLRRSAAVELCRWLLEEGAVVPVFDPAVKSLPPDLARAERCESATDALMDAEAAVVATEWPEFRNLAASELKAAMKTPVLLDANRFLQKSLGDFDGMRYIAVGTPKGKALA